MARIAYLLSRNMLATSADARDDIHEYDTMRGAFFPAFAERGHVIEPVIWDDWQDAHNFDAALIGPTWDYWDRFDAFFRSLQTISESCTLINPIDVVQWNIDKIYLKALQEQGCSIVPTAFADRMTAAVLTDAAEKLDTPDLIIKPRIGADAFGLQRIDAAAPPAELPVGAMLIQAFQPRIVEGERSLMFYGGRYSHAVRKIPAVGDIRTQGHYGATLEPHDASADEMALGECALRACPALPAYARIDMISLNDDRPAIMEMELIEPYHYTDFVTDAGPRLVRACEATIAG